MPCLFQQVTSCRGCRRVVAADATTWGVVVGITTVAIGGCFGKQRPLIQEWRGSKGCWLDLQQHTAPCLASVQRSILTMQAASRHQTWGCMPIKPAIAVSVQVSNLRQDGCTCSWEILRSHGSRGTSGVNQQYAQAALRVLVHRTTPQLTEQKLTCSANDVLITATVDKT